MTMVQLIGITAGFDALLAVVAWLIVWTRQQKRVAPPSQVVSYFQSYLLWTTVFLVLTAVAMLFVTGTAQAVTVLISDLVLWVSLAYFIILVAVGRSSRNRTLALGLLIFCGALGTLYQIASLLGISLALGAVVTYLLANMAPLLMYFVWLPSALIFFASAMRAPSFLVRLRFFLFGIGLVLITTSWAWRLLITNPPVEMIMIVSALGFIGILAGVIYQGKPRPRLQTARS